MAPVGRHDPKVLTIALGSFIFGCEALVMILLGETPTLTLVDSVLLLLIVSPALYVLYTESKRRIEFEREVEKERNLFKHIFDSAGEGVCLISSDYTIVMANRRLEELVGKGDLVGRKCYEICPCESCGTEDCAVNRVLNTGSVVSLEKRAKVGNREVWFGITSAPFRDVNGRIVGVVSFIRDRTERKKLEENLKRSKEELERHAKLLEEQKRKLEEQYEMLREREKRERLQMELLSTLNSVDVAYIAKNSIKKLVKIANGLLGAVYVFDDEKGDLRCYATYSVDDRAIERISSSGFPKEVYERNEIMSFEDDLEVDFGIGRMRLGWVLGLPLTFQKKRLGCIVLGGNEETDLELLRSCVSAIASAINNALTYRLIQLQAKQLEEMNKELVKANRLKDEFLANVSHELKTPLNSIIGFTNIMLKRESDEKKRRYLEKILRNAQHLLNLINDLLDLSKIEAGKIEIRMKPTNLTKLVEECVESLRPQAESKGLYLKFEAVEDILIETDPDRVRQILLNLLSNAVKFTEKGGITVKMETDDGFVKIHVIDTGVGIPKDKIEKIFDKFVQVGEKRAGGTGLGLTISKKLAELLGGRITVESEVGKGSVFTLWLPLRRVDRVEEEDKDAFVREGLGKVRGKTVLIVDDDEDAIELLKNYIGNDFNVIVAKSGEDALRVAKERKPDLILLDIVMPGMDGWEVLKRLKSDRDTADIPVVIVSIVAEKRKGLYLGAVDCLTKPVSKEELLYTLVRALRRYECGKVLVVDDDEDFLQTMVEMLKDKCREIRTARNGVEALMILKEFKPDVIFLDLMMPVMDGFKFLEIVKGKDGLRDIPIVIVTAKDLNDEEKEILKQRTVAILNKTPHLEEEIAEELRRICGGKG